MSEMMAMEPGRVTSALVHVNRKAGSGPMPRWMYTYLRGG